FRQNLLHVAIEPSRLALVVRLPVQRPVGLHDLWRKSVDIIGPGLARGEHPPSRTYTSRQPRAGMRNWHRQQGLNGDPFRRGLASVIALAGILDRRRSFH